MSELTTEREWLYRFAASEWLTAALNELVQAEGALLEKHHRSGLVGARRAAGMGINAILVHTYDERYGRSYMEHLQALQNDAQAPQVVRDAAAALVTTPLQTDIVTIGPGDTRLAAAARLIIEYAHAVVTPKGQAS